MTRRDRIALTVVAMAALLGAYWFLVLAPKREQAATLKTQIATQRTRLQTAQSDLAASQAARSSYAANYTAVAQLGKAVPADDDIASLVYQLDSTAGASSINFQSIKLASSPGAAPVAPPAAPAPAPATGGASSSASATSTSGGGTGTTPSASPTSTASSSSTSSTASAPSPGAGGQPPAPGTPSAAPTQAATATMPPGAVVGPAGLATMPFTFTFDGSFMRLSQFFGRVERYISARNRAVDTRGRLLTINGLSLTFTQQGYPRLKASVAATAYLLPASEGLVNGASPTAPPQTGAQPATGQANSTPTPAPATVAGP